MSTVPKRPADPIARSSPGAVQTVLCAVSLAGLALFAIGCADAPAAQESAPGAPSTASGAAAGEATTAPATAVAPQAAPQKQFPPQDHLNKIVAAYNVASANPELLTGLPCYCPCELYGHGGVIDCHRSQHAAMCDVCMNEAIEAGQLYEQQRAAGVDDIAAVQAQVKDRYRRALMADTVQRFPAMNTPQGQAFVQACSDCHQPPSPAMHLPADWAASLQRMEQYARGKGGFDEAQWQAASQYVQSISSQVPPATVTQFRQSLATTVEHLKNAEGDAAYYPSVRDPVLDPSWAERMAAAYNGARSLPAELLASTPTTCQECVDSGNTNLLACLNSMQAIVCETAIDEVERLIAEYPQSRQ